MTESFFKHFETNYKDVEFDHNGCQVYGQQRADLHFRCNSFIPFDDVDVVKNQAIIDEKLGECLTKYFKKRFRIGNEVSNWLIEFDDNWHYGCDITITIFNNKFSTNYNKWYDDLVRKEMLSLTNEIRDIFEDAICYIHDQCIEQEELEEA